MTAASWTWTYHDAEGIDLTPPCAPERGFPTQADAETWVGETWQELLAEGVESVSLHEDEDVVYGPMSLRPTQ